MLDFMRTLPWTLIGTALFLCASLSILVIVERKRDKRDRRMVAVAEKNLGAVIYLAQKHHTETHGQPNADLAQLEEAIPSLRQGV